MKFNRMDAARTFLLATTNEGKSAEIHHGLHGLAIDLIALHDLPLMPEQPDETGCTFEENAIQKAGYYFEQTGISSIADDSGVLVDALDGELGVHTRRWGAGHLADDDEWIRFFLDKMRTKSNRRAEFVSVLALAGGDGIHTFEGRCAGVITESLESDYLSGLPISACFRPDGFCKVFAALSTDEKNSVSHRGLAVAKLRTHLDAFLRAKNIRR